MPRKTGVPRVCQQCQRPFLSLWHKSTKPAMYCSLACRDEAQRIRVTVTCVQCGTAFRRTPRHVALSKERGPFCGFRCYGQWQKEHTQGEANPNYKPQSPARTGGQWERARKEALARDRHRCQRCGSTNRLHVHHKIAWEEGQPDPHALDNLETLCASCHRKAHPMTARLNGRYAPLPKTGRWGNPAAAAHPRSASSE